MRGSLLLGLAFTAAALAQPGSEDLQVWQTWKSIDAATTLAPLDGPDEVLEKAEIIADRRDALSAEQRRISERCEAIAAGVAGVEQQLEGTREIIRVRGGRDGVLRRRVHAFRTRKRELEDLGRVCEESRSGLSKALADLGAQHTRYLEQAKALRAEEGTSP